MKTYRIQYTITNDRGVVIRSATIDVKNCLSPHHSQVKLRHHLDKLYWDLHKLVIHSVTGLEDPIKKHKPSGGFGSMLDELFGKSFNGTFNDPRDL